MNGILSPATEQRIKELNQEDEAILAENRRQNEVVRQARIKLEQEALDERNAEREAQRLNKEEKLKAELRANFMAGNPSASAEDFERLYPAYRDAYMIAEAEREYERQLTSGRAIYNIL